MAVRMVGPAAQLQQTLILGLQLLRYVTALCLGRFLFVRGQEAVFQ